MDRRQTLIAVLITFGAILLLFLISSLFKIRGNSEHSPQQTHQAAAPHQGTHSAPNDAVPAGIEPEGYEALIGCELIETRTNRGSLLHMSHNGKPFKLRLYYAESPYLQVTNSATTNREGAIPALAGTRLTNIAETSANYTLSKLRDNTFKVFTRWEKAEDDETFYGWILLSPGGEDPRYLSEFLVANGYASILRSHADPPAGPLDHSSFMKRLNSLQQIARSSRLGAFANDRGA